MEHKKRIRGIIYGAGLAAIVIAVQVFVNYAYRDEHRMESAFIKSNATAVQSKLQVVGDIGVKYMTEKDKEELIDYVSSKLGIVTASKKETVEGDKTVSVVARTQGETANTSIECISVQAENSLKIEETNQYLYVTIGIKGEVSSILEYKDMVEQALEEVGTTAIDTSVVFEGVYDSVLRLSEKNKITDQIIQDMQAKVVNESRRDEMYTVYCYTPLIENSIDSNGSRINLNIAFSTDEGENKTTIYLATPILNEDY